MSFKPVNGFAVLKESDPQPVEGVGTIYDVLAVSGQSCELRVKDQVTLSGQLSNLPYQSITFEGDSAVVILEQYVTGIILSPG